MPLSSLAIEDNPYTGLGFIATGRKGFPTVNPVAGETSDGFLSDLHPGRLD